MVPDFKKLGPKFGKKMKAAAEIIKALDRKQIAELEANGSIAIDVDGETTAVDLADVKVISEDMDGWLVANDGDLTVALDIEISPALFREIINRVQNIRKKRDYDITDHINIQFLPCPEIEPVIAEYGEYIATQVLADAIVIDGKDGEVEILDIDDLKLGVIITPA